MKKVLFLAVVLLALGVKKINAQVIVEDKTIPNKEWSPEDIKFGAKAGLNISAFIKSDFFNTTPKPGGYVGGLVEIPITDEIYAQPEMVISFQHTSFSIDGNGSIDQNLIYLLIPLMGKYQITDEFAAEFGPQLGFVLSDNISEIKYSDGITQSTLKSNAFQLALNFGGGYRLNDNFYFQARLSLGLTKTIKDFSCNSGVLQIGAVYFF